jgi:hypothetical protein
LRPETTQPVQALLPDKPEQPVLHPEHLVPSSTISFHQVHRLAITTPVNLMLPCYCNSLQMGMSKTAKNELSISSKF